MHPAATLLFLASHSSSPRGQESVPFRFEEAIAAVGDITGDGVQELAVAITGGVALYSGATGGLVWRSQGSASSLAPIQDVNGDGVRDVLSLGLFARILSGKDGTELRRFEARGGRDVDALGDVDGDGSPEFLVAAGKRALVLSTRAGAAEAVIGTEQDTTDCHPMRVVGDVDGDGHLDIGWFDWTRDADGGAFRNRIRLASGRTREELPSIALLTGCEALEGFTLAAAGDVDRDGRADVLIAYVGGCAQTYSGRDGKLLVSFEDPCPGGYIEGFGDTAVALGDLDGDHVSEIAFGCKEYMDSGDGYYVAICSGRTGKKLHVFQHDHWPGHFHFVAAPGDVNGDGVPDVAVLVPECGSLTLHSGKDFTWLRTLHPPSG